MNKRRKKKIKVEPRFYVIMTTLALGIVSTTGRVIQTPAKTSDTEAIKTQHEVAVEQAASPVVEQVETSIVDITEEVLTQNETSEEQVAEDMESQVYGEFYSNVISVPNPNDIVALVNKNYQLSSDYKPEDLVVLNVAYADNVLGESQTMLRKEAASHVEEMFSQAKREGVILLAKSGYRSYKTQDRVYNNYVSRDGVALADTYSARAGHSEHQLGLALDVTSDSVYRELTTDFAKTKEGRWIENHAHEYGFIVRYQKDKESLTGYQYEPWHIRYVGVKAAKEIFENDWLLEDYILAKSK